MGIKIIGSCDLPPLIDELISDSLEISIASAFFSPAGFSMLEKYLKKYNHLKEVQIMLDEDFHPEATVRKELIHKLMALPSTEIRLFCDRDKLFHSKIYIFTGDDKIQAIVGSSNLTAGGLLHNVETNVLLSLDVDAPEVKELRFTFNKYWNMSKTAQEYLQIQEGYVQAHNYKISDKVIIINKSHLGIGKIVEIEGTQVDIYFKEKGAAETAHIQEIDTALDPFELIKEGNLDQPPVKFELRTQASRLPVLNHHGILGNSIIEILPHQILAAHKVITSNKRRMLLADEVGLGKTFEAGIIIKELMSRGEASRILIVTPAGLVTQWQEDMKKFEFDFIIYQSGLEISIADFWNRMDLVIVSIDTLKVRENLNDCLSSKEWDVIVFDEAHHLTRKDYGDKADKSDRYIAAEQIKNKTKAMLFLTATPHQGDRNKFFNLIALLDLNIFKDEDDLFRHRERLDEIMIRQRKIDVTDDQGQPLFVKRIVNALRYTPTPEESKFFRYLTDYLRTGYNVAEESMGKRYQALGFVMVTFQKIAASSIYAIRMALQVRLIRLMFIELEKCTDESEVPKLRDDIVAYAHYKYPDGTRSNEIFGHEKNMFEKYLQEEGVDPLEFVGAPDEINLLKKLLAYLPEGDETKLIKLLEAINTIKKDYPQEKFIIFTEYLQTQNYIVRKLKEVYDDDDVVLIRGGDHREKIQAAKKFKSSSHFLVSTQAGGEGFNLHHCHIVFNYDMPWNPMKVEQRIGRIHRYKQKDTAQIYNMFANDTIENRIYERLEEKLSEITKTIGSDDERETFKENILGIVAEDLNFDDLYKEALRKGQEAYELTKEKIDAAVTKAKEVYEKLGDLTQSMEKFNLEKYHDTKGDVSLSDVEKFILDFLKSENKRVSKDDEGYFEFLVPEIIPNYGGRKYTKVTFDRQKAIEDPTLHFMALGHPVTDAIINTCSGYGYRKMCHETITKGRVQQGVWYTIQLFDRISSFSARNGKE